MTSLKRVVERTLAVVGRSGVARGRVLGKTLILAYHNIVPDDAPPDGDRPLHLPLHRFRAHLDVLAQHCDVVALTDLGREPVGRPRAVITFDDAYRGALVLGIPELERRGLPATIFVAPGYLGGGTFWWDDVARATGHALDASLRTQALEEWRGREDEVRAALPAAVAAASGASAWLQCCDETELRAAVGSPMISLGSHSWSHPNLTRLSAAELEDELVRPIAWLREHFPSATVPAISYPYGLVSGDVRTAAAATGYGVGLMVMGGWSEASADPLILPRKNVPAGLSAAGLAIRVAGLMAP